jgi:uncharacterized membrane protein
MGKLTESFYHFVWNLNDLKRVSLCIPFGVGMFLVGRWFGWVLEISFLAGWNFALALYIILLGIVIITADKTRTRQRISQVDPTRGFLVLILSMVALLGNMSVGAILTAVGQRSAPHARLLLGLSVIAVILSWLLLHTAFGQHYSRLYYDDTDSQGRPFPEGLRRGFNFPGTPEPTYLDFLYVSFTIALTYAMSDVTVTNEVQRRLVLAHSIIAFFFYSTVLAAVLNAIVTS